MILLLCENDISSFRYGGIDMENTFAAVSADDDNHHILTIKADKGETIRVGQKISINPFKDIILCLMPENAGDYSLDEF